MKKNGLTLKDISSLLNVSQSTIHGWLNGVPPKSIPVVQKLATAFNLSIEDLCFDIKETKSIANQAFETNLTISIGDDQFKLILKKIPKII